MLPLLVLLGTIAGAWYLLIVRPQRSRQTQHGRLVDQLQVGDHVLTVGGIYGRVVAIEGPSVVLELAPGLTSRIATDGIARIVQAGDAALPTPATPVSAPTVHDTPRAALDTDMYHEQQQHAAPQQQPATTGPAPTYAQPAAHAPQFLHQVAPAWHAPQQPYAYPPAAPVTGAPVAQQQVAMPLRAQVVEHAPVVATHEPPPWRDAAPVNARPASTWQPPQPPPMPVHVPFGTTPMQAVAVAPTATPAPAVAPPVQYGVPPVQPLVAVAHQPIHVQQAPAPVQANAAPVAEPRRHSSAPQGMGSSLRLDDPTIRDVMARARDERTGLADEYRKLTAPLVDVGAEPVLVGTPIPVDAMVIGHDPNGQPLFAAPGTPGAQPVAHYPSPVRVQAPSAVPRPNIEVPGASVDPALTTAAFQRRTPYAPEHGTVIEPVQGGMPVPMLVDPDAHVHAHG